MVANRSHWGVRVRELLDAKGMTQSELARKSGLSTATITKIVKGRSNAPEDNTINSLAHGFGISSSSLRQIIYGQSEIRQESITEIIGKLSAALLEVPIYNTYPASAKELQVTTLFLRRTAGMSKNVTGYLLDFDVEGFTKGEDVIIDHDRIPKAGNNVIFVHDGQVKIGTLKIIVDSKYIISDHKNIPLDECSDIGVIIGVYRDLL
jgi:transcriptional regulator with XRE-family HTH domain